MYAICILLGVCIGFLICVINKNKYDNDVWELVDYAIGTILFGIIGARFYYVIFNFENYKNNIVEILNIRDGGLAIYGGLICGFLFIVSFSKIRKKDFVNLLDYIITSVALAQSIGRFGNFFNIEAYGYETNSIFRMGINTYNSGYIEVHPTFLYESIANIIICILLLKIQNKRQFKGQIILLYVIFYSFIRTIIEGLRQDSLMFFDFRISQILSIVLFLVSIAIYLVEKCNTKKRANNDN